MMNVYKAIGISSVAFLGWVLAGGAIGAVQDFPTPRVEVETVSERLISPEIQVPGTVISVNDSRIGAEVSGQIIWVAEVGTLVKKGEMVMHIDDRNAQTTLAQAQAQVRRLEADLEFRIKEVVRIEELAEQGNTPISRLEGAISVREMTAQELVQANAVMERAQHDLERTQVRAPFPGRVVERISQVGEFAVPGRELVRLVDTEHLEITAQAPVSTAPYLSDGREVVVLAAGLGLQTSIRSVVPVGDTTSRMMELRVEIGADQWVIGTAVRVSIPSDAPRRVIAVPRDALILRANSIYVIRVNAQNVTERVDVRTGAASGRFIEVIGNLNAGDNVVIRGGERLQPGQSVDVTESS